MSGDQVINLIQFCVGPLSRNYKIFEVLTNSLDLLLLNDGKYSRQLVVGLDGNLNRKLVRVGPYETQEKVADDILSLAKLKRSNRVSTVISA